MQEASKKEIFLVVIFLLALSLFTILAFSVITPGSLHVLVNTLDSTVHQWVLNHGFPSGVAKFMLFFTYLGNPEIIISTEIVLLLIFFVIQRKLLASFFLGGLIAGEAVSLLLKNSFERIRPEEALYQVSRSGFSFPSGHALISTIFYGFTAFCLIHAFPKRWQKISTSIIAACFILLIGFSRVFLGVHWASDVLGGWLLGSVVLILLIMLFTSVHQRVKWHALELPHGIALSLITVMLAALSFYIFYYYVTHELVIRSIV